MVRMNSTGVTDSVVGLHSKIQREVDYFQDAGLPSKVIHDTW